jgi:hypothetical protein
MKKTVPEKLESGRITTGEAASHPSWGFYGAFEVQGPCGAPLRIVSSGADADDAMSEGWEHVSISTRWRPPNWQEMCFVKDLCWDAEECVVQFHPPRSEYVNNHPNCLHLWKPTKHALPLPPSILVGHKALGELTSTEARLLRRINAI